MYDLTLNDIKIGDGKQFNGKHQADKKYFKF